MGVNHFKIAKKIFAFAFIGCIVLLTVNSTLYKHSHILEDGTLITHAHPYSKGTDNSPIKSHHHSQIELLIFSISIFLPVAANLFVCSHILKRAFFFYPLKEKKYYAACLKTTFGRAPPYSFAT